LIIALGTAIADDFNIEKLRYHRVIIMTDADVDGAHIRTLLLTLFFRYFKEIIEKGHLYIAQPPLYRVSRGKEAHYAYNEADKDSIINDFKKAKKEKIKIKIKSYGKEIKLDDEELPEEEEEKKHGFGIQRYKGLGEMNPQQLWETTMDPKNRVMKQVKIDDANAADKMFNILMGDEVFPRKRFIQTHAKNVKNLDI